jgi:hypothetical protein
VCPSVEARLPLLLVSRWNFLLLVVCPLGRGKTTTTLRLVYMYIYMLILNMSIGWQAHSL